MDIQYIHQISYSVNMLNNRTKKKPHIVTFRLVPDLIWQLMSKWGISCKFRVERGEQACVIQGAIVESVYSIMNLVTGMELVSPTRPGVDAVVRGGQFAVRQRSPEPVFSGDIESHG